MDARAPPACAPCCLAPGGGAAGEPSARALPADRQAGQGPTHALPGDAARRGVPQIWRQQGRGPDRRARAQGVRVLGQHSPKQRIDAGREPAWATAVAPLRQTFPHGQGLAFLEGLDPMRYGLARHVQALRHRGKTFPLIEPEQSLYTVEFLGLRGVCSERFPEGPRL